jgi:hypothetical protein
MNPSKTEEDRRKRFEECHGFNIPLLALKQNKPQVNEYKQSL